MHAPWLDAVRDPATAIAVSAERGALMALEGSCRTAIGAHARLDGLTLSLIVEALTPTGSARFRREGAVTLSGLDDHDRAKALGVELGDQVRLDGGDLILLPETALS